MFVGMLSLLREVHITKLLLMSVESYDNQPTNLS